MKRSVIASILGISLLAGINATGQGGIIINNYQPPYNAANWPVWSPLAGQGIRSTDGVDLTLWYGEGILTADQLLAGPLLNWNLAAESSGYYGYYYGQITLPFWDPGDTYTFQVRASGNSIYGPIADGVLVSQLWYENENILFVGGNPAGAPGLSTYSIGLGIPEPSSFALAGLGFAALLFTRHTHRARR